eukprot:15440778-Alexandrium_andersonii.AAC.1
MCIRDSPVEPKVELGDGEREDPVGPEVVEDPEALASPLKLASLILEDGGIPALVSCTGSQEDAQ